MFTLEFKEPKANTTSTGNFIRICHKYDFD